MVTVTARHDEVPWTPLREAGVDTRGIHVKILRTDASGRPPTFLLRFEPGARYPEHRHPAGEEVYVLAGTVRFGSIHLEAGDYLFTPPGENHDVSSDTGCELLFLVPQEVEILG